MKEIWSLYQKQIIIAIAVIAVVIVFAVVVGRKVKKSKSGAYVDDNVRNQEPKGWEDQVNDNPQPQSYPNPQYNSWAAALESAMKGAGTDEEIIFDVHGNLNNNKDFEKLQSAFGQRTYIHTAGPYAWFEKWFNTPLSLSGWISHDLNQDERDELNQILSSKGITYRY